MSRLRVFKTLAKQYQSSSGVVTNLSWKRLLDLSMMHFALSVAWSRRGSLILFRRVILKKLHASDVPQVYHCRRWSSRDRTCVSVNPVRTRIARCWSLLPTVSDKLMMWYLGTKIIFNGCSAYAESLEVIPMTLAENAGLNPIATVTDLRNKHACGFKSSGINVRKVW